MIQILQNNESQAYLWFFPIRTKFSLKYLYILLKSSWLTVLQVHSKVIQLKKYTDIIFQISFHYRLLQDTDYGTLC